jgi:AcrR family transcriptional regulator
MIKGMRVATNGLRADTARNRAKVLKVARKRLEEGDTELPMNTIAKLAGVGVGTVYRHFPTRRALLETLAMDGFERLLAAAEAAAAVEDPELALRTLLHGALMLQLDDIGMTKVLELSAEEGLQTTAEIRERIGVAAGGVFDRALASGGIRPGVTRDDLRRLLGGITHAARMQPARSAEEAEVYLDILLDGLRSSR